MYGNIVLSGVLAILNVWCNVGVYVVIQKALKSVLPHYVTHNRPMSIV